MATKLIDRLLEPITHTQERRACMDRLGETMLGHLRGLEPGQYASQTDVYLMVHGEIPSRLSGGREGIDIVQGVIEEQYVAGRLVRLYQTEKGSVLTTAKDCAFFLTAEERHSIMNAIGPGDRFEGYRATEPEPPQVDVRPIGSMAMHQPTQDFFRRPTKL